MQGTKVQKGEKMNNLKRKTVPVLSIALYTLAGLLLLYTVWALIHSIGYISEMVSQEQLVISGNEYDIVSFYMTSCGQYALFTVILFSLGRILQKSSYCGPDNFEKEIPVNPPAEALESKVDEEDFEDGTNHS